MNDEPYGKNQSPLQTFWLIALLVEVVLVVIALVIGLVVVVEVAYKYSLFGHVPYRFLKLPN